MMFHMLRRMVGDDAFLSALRDFYASMKFKRASFSDVRKSFEKFAGLPLDWFFDQWVSRAGAPVLELERPALIRKGDHYLLSFSVSQTQPEGPYRFTLPVSIAVEGEKKTQIKAFEIREREERIIEGPYDKKPVAIALDPAFDVFRRLDYREIPPSIGQNFSAEKVLVILPTSEGKEMQRAYQRIAATWSRSRQTEVSIVDDASVERDALKGCSVWVLGYSNRLRKAFLTAASVYDVAEESTVFRLAGKSFPVEGRSFAVCVRNPEDPRQIMTWLAADPPEAIDGLARKLPHYGKYSYLVFEGSEPTNVHKGQWLVKDSPMVAFLDKTAGGDATTLMMLPSRESLAAKVPNPVQEKLINGSIPTKVRKVP
jgi:aminopeptidase N